MDTLDLCREPLQRCLVDVHPRCSTFYLDSESCELHAFNYTLLITHGRSASVSTYNGHGALGSVSRSHHRSQFQ